MNVNISNRTVLEIVTVVWFIVSIGYLTHTPHKHRSHDFHGHVHYTMIIANEKRLPAPYIGWETFQPPLYYLIASLIPISDPKVGSFYHVEYVRYLSVLYGLITLFLIGWFLELVDIKPFYKLLVLLLIATTPKFVFIFSSYNNDSLSTLLCISIITFVYKLLQSWSWQYACVLLLVSTSALYTKYSSLLATLTMLLYCFKNLLRFKLLHKSDIKTACILIASITLYAPWIYFHNYKNTGKLFPTNIEKYHEDFIDKSSLKVKFKNITGIVFRIPHLQTKKVDYTHEWDKPWTYPQWEYVHPSTKRYDYFAFTFVSSVIGEYIFKNPDTKFIWAILLIHLLIGLLSLKKILNSSLTKLAAFIILVTNLEVIFLLLPQALSMPCPNFDFRYIAWIWMGWAILYTSLFSSRYKLIRQLTSLLFMLGIILQVYILFTVKGGFWY